MGSPKGLEPSYIWQDREIRFDANPAELECRRGEVLIEALVRGWQVPDNAVRRS